MRTDKKKVGTYELIRFCNKLNCSVVGGASRLFKHFIKEMNPISVISYCDRDWSTGNLYTKLGFELTHTTVPGFSYIVGNHRVGRRTFTKDKLDYILESEYNMSEHAIMLSKKIYRVYDSGNYVFMWSKLI